MSNLQFSVSPHVRSGNSTKKIMLNVCIALLPATIMGIVYFGIFAALTVLVSLISAVPLQRNPPHKMGHFLGI